MNTQLSSVVKPKFFEKKYLASRIACLLFIVTWSLYLFGGRPFAATLISVGAILLFGLQFIYQFKAINGILGGIMFLVSIYFSLAAWSEFSEFEVVTSAARELLIVGWSLCLIGVVLSLLMIISAIRDLAV